MWPDVPVAAWRQGLEVVAHVTSRALGTPAAGVPIHVELPASGLPGFGVAVFTSGMGPLMGHWLEEGTLEAEEPVRKLLAEHLRHGRARATRMRTLLERIAAGFDEHDLPMTLLKGSHTGETYFPEPGTRPLHDVDIAVPRDRFEVAERVLADMGFTKTGSQPGPIRSDWSEPADRRLPVSLALTHEHSPLSVDLHGSHRRKLFGIRTLDLSPSREDLVLRSDLPGQVHAVDGPLLALTVATHASEDLEGMQILRLVELCLIRRTWAGAPVYGPEALERARALGALRFTYPALALTERLVPGTVDPDYLDAAATDAPRRMHRIVDGLSPASGQRIAHHTLAERFMAAKGPLELLRRTAHLLVPTSTGFSLGRLTRLYKERWFRLRRGTVRVGEPG